MVKKEEVILWLRSYGNGIVTYENTRIPEEMKFTMSTNDYERNGRPPKVQIII